MYASTLLVLWALAELDLADSGFWPPAVGDELLEPWFGPASGVALRAELIEEPFRIG
jgi:hypothetical protein